MSVEGHYELVSLAGDSWEASGFYSSFSQKFSEDDATALLDLASEITSCREYAAWHRIDRLNVTLETGKSRVTLGRQAVTWGNGLLFNPMDVFNPFSPYDIERDYKKGNDMACVQMFLDSGDDFECLYVPRRDEKNGGIASEASSFAFKFHHFSGNMEFDIMAARHYDGALFGAGCSGYLGGAVWRADAVYASGGSLGDDYLNFVANIDYSWVWNGKNVYGFAEFFCSGLGEADCSEALLNEDLYTLVSRGEIFTWGRLYLAVNVDIEVTALLNAGVTVISNLDDGSSLLQPTMVWDAAENMEVTVGAGVGTGGSGDEYGQLEQPLSESPIDKGNTLFLWVTRFF